MNCPICSDPMLVIELDEIEIDYCENCGIWLDAGELGLLLESRGKKEALLASFTPDAGGGEKPRGCPICSKKMEKVLCGLDEKVRIDRCRDGHGLWFDKGELAAVLRMGAFDPEGQVLGLLKQMFRTNQATETGG